MFAYTVVPMHYSYFFFSQIFNINWDDTQKVEEHFKFKESIAFLYSEIIQFAAKCQIVLSADEIMKLAACSRHRPITNSKYRRKLFPEAGEFINQQFESLDPSSDAWHLLDEMRKPDVTSETALIRNLVKQKFHKDAFLWF